MTPLRTLCCAIASAFTLLAIAGTGTPGAQERPPPSRDAALLSQALAAASTGDLTRARALSAGLGDAARTLVRWNQLRNGHGTLQDFASFMDQHPHWPLQVTLQRRAEALLTNAPHPVVLAFLADREPVSAAGGLALFGALRASSQPEAARALAQRLWSDFTLSAAQEATLLDAHPDALAPLHAARLDALLWRREHAAAERMLPRVTPPQARLARARLGLQQRVAGVNALIDAVPDTLADDPGLAHDRFEWRMQSQLYDSAGELLLEQSTSPEALGDPEAWALRRVFLVRTAMSEGAMERAYRLAAGHHLEDGARFADLTWLAGFIALRHLDRPEDALRHFRALRLRTSSPISLGRAGYWEGRAYAALGDPISAETAFAFGAEHQTAYYGQLASEAVGLPIDRDLVTGPDYPHWRDTDLAGSDLLEAALLLRRAGQWHEARRLILHLAWQLDDTDRLGALGDLMLALDEPNFAVNVAKIAVQSGIVLPRAYFPITPLADAPLPAPTELVMAIARRESEFDPAVVSPADARGLMQVLPGTGALMARRLGIADFDPAQLTSDPIRNARLGAAYLAQLTDEFGPSLALVAAGYNAGPGRPRAWIERLGDPRQPSVDVIDWVESVPFAETRNYIMRVAESLVLYRTRLAGAPAPIGMEALLRGTAATGP